MATLRDIRKRISSVKNTQKITKAMKMVAAAKLRRAQMAVIGTRPYAEKINKTLGDLIQTDSLNNPLFHNKKQCKKVMVLVFTSNRGLCGGFNSNLLRKTHTFLKNLRENDVEHYLFMIGKKGREFFRARQTEINEINIDFADQMTFEQAFDLAHKFIDAINAESADEIYIIYNKFVSALTQETQILKLLPLSMAENKNTDAAATIPNYIFEPGRADILENLIPRCLAMQIYKAHLESKASELGARMSAMDNATNNAKDMIGALTLQFNRARQAAITVELMDIVNGAEAIK